MEYMLGKLSMKELQRLNELTPEALKKLFSDELIYRRDNSLSKRLAMKEARLNESQKMYLETFSSARMPYYQEKYAEKCNALLSCLSSDDVWFLYNASFRDAGNNTAGNLSYHLFSSDRQLYFEINKLANLDKFFYSESHIIGYEGIYNTLNYIKNYIFYLLEERNGNVHGKEDILSDYEEKKVIVRENIKDIAQSLLEIRNTVEGSRVSVSNKSLSVLAAKTNDKLTYTQNKFVEAVAFGSSYNKLRNENYEDAKRLLFLPRK